MNDQQQRHVFISYVRENQEQVDRLCQDLERYGVNVWLDRKSINPGSRWKDAIREAIRYGDFFIACFSKEYTSRQKSFMNEELTLAIDELRQFASDREWFIPVLLSECDVPARSIGAGESLLDINWVPLYGDWNIGIQRILSVVKPIPPEIQRLISSLSSEHRDVRLHTVHALGEIGPEAKAALPSLVKLLKDEDRYVRWSAARAMMKIGPASNSAVPALIEMLKDENWWVRSRAGAALMKIGPEASAAVPALAEALKDENGEVRLTAVEALANLGVMSKNYVSKISECLEDTYGKVRRAAVSTLGDLGLTSKNYVPKINAVLEDKDYKLREAAEKALKKINTPEARKALEEYKQKSN